ncbi:helix-turn-helix domain-containing protein [Candidimonas nitroreducens]|uniref:Transcriptional regulator n=1 Tax=Candidimonas nitroreducens TaxID=683354 RepID=A0A225MCM0_9BURK|nr:helix-turn-helix transcriptional regulator [Candidimonas nitroreducens]OWT59045.1 transcriptional regulator [Candidimonas nitroreducens]
MNTFAERMRHARKLRHLTQAEVAIACGLSQGAIANYESGNRAAPKDIFGLAEALKVNAFWLRHGKGEMDPVPLSEPLVDEPGPKGSTHTWPFERIPPQSYWNLSVHDRQLVESTVLSLITSLSGGQ